MSSRWAGMIGGLWLLSTACMAHQPQAEPSWISWPEGDSEAGKQAFVRVGCAACHTVAGVDDIPAPTVKPAVPVVFGRLGASRPSTDRLVESIINPDAHVSLRYDPNLVRLGDQSRMADFTRALTVRELIDIVAFLQGLYDVPQG